MSRRWLVITFLLGLAGTGLFFPMRLGIHQTNPFQFFFAKDDCGAHTPEEMARCPLHQNTITSSALTHAEQEKRVELFLLQRYLFPYGFLWWLSLAIVGWCVYQHVRRDSRVTSEEVNPKDEKELGT